MMAPPIISDLALEFVNRCQFAVLAGPEQDYIARVLAIWNCLAIFPCGTSDDDLAAPVGAVYRVAAGFFVRSDHRAGDEAPTRHGGRRAHVNALLELAQRRHADADLTLGQLARVLGLSTECLSRSLGEETSHLFRCAFRTHVNGVRILAATLQMPSSASVSAIARDVGYRRTGELDRQFDRWFKLSPRRFRHLLVGVPVVLPRR